MSKVVKFRTDGEKGGAIHVCDEGTWRKQATNAVRRGQTVILGDFVGYSLEEAENYETGEVVKVRAAFNYYGLNGQTRVEIKHFPWEVKGVTGERATESDGGLWIQGVAL